MLASAFVVLRKRKDEEEEVKQEKKSQVSEEKVESHHETLEKQVDLTDYRFARLKRLCDQNSDILDFRGFGMDQEDALNLGVLLAENVQDLEYLHLSKNALTDLGMVQVLLALKQHRSTLQGLTIGGNDLTISGGIQALTDALPTFGTLEYLCFDGFQEMLPRFGKLMRRVALLDQLRELEFKNNDLTTDQMVVMERYLRSSHCHIKILSFYEETLITTDCLTALTRGLKYSYKLRLLTLSHMRFSVDQIKIIGDYMADGCCLDMLELSHNNLSDGHLEVLAPGLFQNKVLTTMDLSSNHISSKVVSKVDTEIYLREQLDTPVILTVIIRDNYLTEEELESEVAGFQDLVKTRFVFILKDESTTSGPESTD
eukprot:CAMPEP_0114994816 /NCGR_PEP_ID=MMETSP0216-20121206/13357_1 /TAXON_ID=223996 /ORGANISM="Protocruzia adherens, Strain Boccale" /LENGTH=370 /DNA_ID=CAMNT_0002358735 /DNA_START=179 /DNA_END=1291 /DNA_ORIENTATION=+